MNFEETLPIIYTVGHSNHSLEYFLELLDTHQIQCVADVRSVPASRYNPQYNQVPLKAALKCHGKLYLSFCAEFGARSEDKAVLDEQGIVDFQKAVQTVDFLRGVERLKQGLSKQYRIVLMCSEAEPFDCHRFAMLAVALQRTGISVLHILKDKTLLTNEALETTLLKKYRKKLPQPSFFDPDISVETQLKAAYRLRNIDIGYQVTDSEQ
jgi:uncharacterized protein (DUF488 family)